MNKQLKSLAGILFIALLFMLVTYFSQEYTESIKNEIGSGIFSLATYIFLLILSDVVPPISSIPFIPIAVGIWGWFYTGIINIIGWSLGAYLCFILGRKYGVSLIKNLVPIEEISKIECKIPKKNFFLSVVLLRMAIPVDILSYALAIFTNMSFRNYMLATVLGIIPFSFIWAYLGYIPFVYQLIIFLIVSIIIITEVIFKKVKNKKR